MHDILWPYNLDIQHACLPGEPMTTIQRFAVLALLVVPVAAQAQEPPAIAKHTRWVTSLAFSNDGAMLVTVGGESLQYRPGDVKLWDPKTGALTASLDGGHPTNVWSVAISTDAKTL